MKTKSLLAIVLGILPLANPARLQARDEKPGNAEAIKFSCVASENLPYPELFEKQDGEYLPSELKIVTPVLPEAGGFLPVVIKNEQGLSLLENRFLALRPGRELVIISPPARG